MSALEVVCPGCGVTLLKIERPETARIYFEKLSAACLECKPVADTPISREKQDAILGLTPPPPAPEPE